jgi:hypothetical protein
LLAVFLRGVDILKTNGDLTRTNTDENNGRKQ